MRSAHTHCSATPAARSQSVAAAFVLLLAIASQAQVAQPPSPPPAPAPALNLPETPKGFTGRYRHGPERALARIVLFSDYQCPDCRRVEQEAMKLAEQHPAQISVSTKQFPFSNSCNAHVLDNPHPNACWAARAAEAAGLMGGPEDFYRVHNWLFARNGAFTDTELRTGLQELGFDPDAFIKVMESPETLQLVRNDIEEAVSLGLWHTPMVFVNGAEVKNASAAPGTLTRVVREILARGGEPATAEADTPPPAAEKVVNDWRTAARIALPPDNTPHALGPADAPVRIVLWGDYQSAQCAEADATLRRLVRERGDMRYEFRQYPAHRDCNPSSPVDLHDQACEAARAAEAVAALKGEDAFWTIHERLFSFNTRLSSVVIRQNVAALGIDAGALTTAMFGPRVATAIAEDGEAAARRGLTVIPFIFINDKPVSRWKFGQTNHLPALVAAAARDAAAAKKPAPTGGQ